MEIYGDWLFERRDFQGAAFGKSSYFLPVASTHDLSLVFRKAKKFEKTMLAYEKGLDWQELFDVAVQQQTSEADLSTIAYRVAGEIYVLYHRDNSLV